MSHSSENFGLNVAKRRSSLNMSQEKLGQMTELSTKTIQRIEAGKSAKSENIPELCDALGVTPNDLFEYRDHDSDKADLSGLSSSFVQVIMQTLDLARGISPEDQRRLALMMKSQMDCFQALNAVR